MNAENEAMAGLLAAASGAPVSVSARTGRARAVEDRVQAIRSGERSGGRGSCMSGYSTWGD